MRGRCNDEQKEFTNRQMCSINGFKLRTRPNVTEIKKIKGTFLWGSYQWSSI